jgi:D-arabinitol dehydrogenase (NADP+)
VEPCDIFRRQLTVKGSFAQVNCFDRSLAMLRSGRVRTDGLVTHRLALEHTATPSPHSLQTLPVSRPSLRPTRSTAQALRSR